VPFFSVAFFRTQNMIKELALPQTGIRAHFCSCGRWPRQNRPNPAARPRFPFPHETRKRLRMPLRRTEKMHVIGHDDVRTNCLSMALPSVAQFVHQNLGYGISRQDRSAPKRAHCDEIDAKLNPYAIESLKVLVQPPML